MKKLILTLCSLLLIYGVASAQALCPASVAHFNFSFSKPVVNNQKIGGASGCDEDAGQILTWSIVETSVPWKIVDGNILVSDATAINSTTTNTYNITIKLMDNGNPPLYSTATVTMTDVNTAPVINSQTFKIAENTANGTLVGTIVANDANANQIKSFAILSGNTSEAFSINASTGAIYVNNTAALDYEITSSFALVIRVTDNGNPPMNSQATITISLTDVNEAPIAYDQTFE